MRKLYSFLLFPLVLVLYLSCSGKPSVYIRNDNDSLAYMGRIDTRDTEAAVIYWPGSSVTMRFEGTEVSALLKDEAGKNYFYVIIDSMPVQKLQLDTIKHLYVLASGLIPGRHSIQLFKLTEATMGRTWFYGFCIASDSHILTPPKSQKRKIEFYGNSITSGYALEDTVADRGEGKYFNNYLSYAATTARRCNAAYHCISKSGIGLMVSWFPIIMPEMYDRLDPEDSNSKWNFTKFKPDVVVIGLFQNDSWLVGKRDHAQFKARFGSTPPGEEYIINAYQNFLHSIRSKYPDASIVCTLGSMDATREGSPWPGYIEKAVAGLNDAKIYTHFFPYKNSPGHPKYKEQLAMADSLISFIDMHIRW